MRGQWIVRRVPESIRTDDWWLSEDQTGTAAANSATHRQRHLQAITPAPLGAVAVMTLTADLLFWDAAPGVSIAVYALLLSACMFAFKPGAASTREIALGIGFVLLCTLPVIEQAQPLSVAFCVIGLGGLLSWIAFGHVIGVWPSLVLFLRASAIGAIALPDALVETARSGRTEIDFRHAARSLALPIGAGAVFVILFANANPLLEGILEDLGNWGAVTPEHLLRAIFWIVVACALWPYLSARGSWRGEPATLPVLSRPNSAVAALINPASVRTSMILFNAMFAVQTLADLSVLSGGLSLPDGMTYAEYAHRGAYPLAVTALLSGLFAMATNHMTRGNRLLRTLMLLWLGQNLILVLTALFRLGLYVDAYMLTYLRVAAFIWMGLVFAGLVLIVLHIVQGRSLGWLILRTGAITTGTLYLCCFINFAYVITEFNMAAHPDGRLDLAYLCGLGEQAIPAMMDYGQITDQTACGRRGLPSIRFDPINDWREWGFRRWRLQRYLETYHDL